MLRRRSSRRTSGVWMPDSLLEVEGLEVGYGDVPILHGVNLAVGPRERVLLFGPNGSGKSTLLKALSGLITPASGVVRVGGRDVAGWPPERIVRLGISYVPQTDNVFPSLTVAENLQIGGVLDRGATPARMSDVFGLFPALGDLRGQMAGNLSGGERQLLAIGRALMLEPRLLVLDEPSAGLAPRRVIETFEHVVGISRRRGIAVLLVEQNVRQAIKVVDRAYLLERGVVRFQGRAEELEDSDELRHAYLGAPSTPERGSAEGGGPSRLTTLDDVPRDC